MLAALCRVICETCYRPVFLHITCNVKQAVSFLGLQIIFFRKLAVKSSARELNLNGSVHAVLMFFEACLMSCVLDKNRMWGVCQGDFTDGLLTLELHFPTLDLRETQFILIWGILQRNCFLGFLTELTDERS